jgi:GT2 family glycosyltransferase
VACRYDNEKLNPVWARRTHLNPQRDGLTSYDYPPFLPHAGGGGLGVRRAVHEEIGGFDETLPALEDTDYCWRIQLAGHSFHFAPEAVVNIRHRHDPRKIFRQGVSYGKHNVLIYQRYRSRGMPRLGWMPGLLRWGKLLLKTPAMLLTREGRSRWLWQMGWRIGRLEGCFAYRVVAP